MSNHQAVRLASLIEAHKRLQSNLQELDALVASPETSPSVLAKRMNDLQALLTEHFHWEEKDGYMQAVLARAPQQERAVVTLQDEHTSLARTLESLRVTLAVRPEITAELRDRFRQWIAQVRDHETRENLLVEDVFNREVTAAD